MSAAPSRVRRSRSGRLPARSRWDGPERSRAAPIPPSPQTPGAALAPAPTPSPRSSGTRPARRRAVPKVELPRDNAGQLWEAPSEAVPGRPLVALHQRMPLQRAEQAQGGRAVDAELAGDVRPRAPAAHREKVEDRDRTLDRADRDLAGRLVAHYATLPLRVTLPPRNLLRSA